MSQPVSIVWFRIDLRLADNPALQAAVKRGNPIVPLFIWAPEEEAPWEPGGASRWWLHQSLKSLSASLVQIGSRLVIRSGPSLPALLSVIKETGADAVFWNRRYEPAVIARDQKIKQSLHDGGLVAESFNAALLHEPWTIANKTGKPFQVFTPFWRHCLTLPDPATPLLTPQSIEAPKMWPKSLALDELQLEPTLPWADGFRSQWQPGETGAHSQLQRFLASAFSNYGVERNRPDLIGTSRLSPHLHFGEISPRQIWHELAAHAKKNSLTLAAWRNSQYLSEVGWREFAHHLLFHFPKTTEQPLRPEFINFPWHLDAHFLKAWQKGQTGYPIVDAGLRELWATGWMHNRARMIVGSFLVKDLLLSWNEGARWFWDTLVDADLAQNTLGWQWIAGCGADAAPYFRVFNPLLQGEKFDPQGDYVRQWCPELKNLPNEWLHQPWAAPAEVLSAAGIKLGGNYPEPIVNHNVARDAALAAFAKIRAGKE